MKASIAALAAVGVLSIGLTGAANAQDYDGPNVAYPVSIVGGFEGAKRATESHLGFYAALNGDLDRDGVIFRALGSYGGFEYGGFPNKVDGDFWQGDLMVGYQWVRNGFDFGVLVGVDYQNYKLTPADPTNPVRGDEVGFKTVVDLESNGGASSPLYFAARGSYSTAFDAYYALGRIGMNVGGGLFVGPEVWAMGDKAGDAQRVGGFLLVDYPVSPTIAGQFSVSVGYQFSDDKPNYTFAEEGMYGTMRFRLALGRESGGGHRAPLK